MDNAQKAIMIGVGLFITILIISIVLLVLNVGLNSSKTATNKLQKLSPELVQQLTTMYVGRTLTKEDCEYVVAQYPSSVVSGTWNSTYTSPVYTKLSNGGPNITTLTAQVYANGYYLSGSGSGIALNTATSLTFSEGKTYSCFLIRDNQLYVVGILLQEDK